MIHAPHDKAPVSSCWIGETGRRAVTIAAPTTFVAAGVEWAAPVHARIELRSRNHHGVWSRWVNAACIGHDSDNGSGPVLGFCGDPVWTGAAQALQIRADRRVDGLQVFLVSDTATRGSERERAAAASALPGQAQAASALPLAQPILHAGPGQPRIIARHAWSQGHGPVAPPQYGDVRMGFVHHSDGTNGYSAAEVPQVIRSIYEFHVHTRGWNDIGYNFAIDRFGRIWEARAGGIDQAVVGAQAGGYNLESFGAVVLGDYMYAQPSAAAQKALEHLYAWKLALHGVPVTGKVTVEVDPADAYYTRFRPGAHVHLNRIAGHRDGCTTDCPGDALYARIGSIRAAAEKLVGDQLALTLKLGAGSAQTGVSLPPHDSVQPPKFLTLETVTITAGQKTPAAGTLTSFGGKPVAAAPIELQTLVLDGKTPKTETATSATTASDGGWAAAIAPMRNVLLRALHPDKPATASPLVVVMVAPAITAALSVHDRRVTVAGRIRPYKGKLKLEVRHPSAKHKLLRTQEVKAAGGAYKHALTLPAGDYQLRLMTAADSHNAAGSSGWKGFRVG